LFFLVGDDFLPNIPTLSIVENSIERILDVYKAQNNLGYLVTYEKGGKGVEINTIALKNLLTQLGTQEEDMVNHKLNSKKLYFEDAVMDKNKIETQNGMRIKFDTYRKDYYAKVFRKVPTKGDVKTLCKNYLEGMNWIINYYVEGCKDWEWHYKYYYAPFLCDLGANVPQKFNPIEENKPLNEHVQLMCILPPSSFNLLPELLRDSYKDPEISEYYPREISKVEIDVSGKRFEYEGVVLVPFCNLEKIKTVHAKLVIFNLKAQCIRKNEVL
jgi:5'-3' exonuclease